VVLVGMPALGVKSEFDVLLLADNSQRILGSKMGRSNIQSDIPKLIELYKQGRLKLDELVSAHYPLEEINEAIASVNRGEALRNIIVFP
jgi:Zn-dependent alcohol dehydrogenase